MTDRTAVFSEDARNGVILGLEQRNEAGGVHGRSLELVVQDYGPGVDRAPQAFQALLDAHVEAVVGPYASEVAVALLPAIDKARVLVLSPVVAALALAGRDDPFVRMNGTTRDTARSLAAKLYERGHRRLALATDLRNRAYHAAWRDDFQAAFIALGGVVVADAEFGAASDTGFDHVVRTLLAGQPDGLVALSSSMDAALIAQQVAKQARAVPMAAVAASDALLELGGRAVEGMVVAQAFNRADQSPRYGAFRAAYLARFGREPSYSAAVSYDAVTVLTQALDQAAPGEALRDAVLRCQPYPGLQQTIRFDRFGDGTRAPFFSIVRNGRFEPL